MNIIELIELIWNWFNRRNLPDYYEESEKEIISNDCNCKCPEPDHSITITTSTQPDLKAEVNDIIYANKELLRQGYYTEIELEALEAEKKIINLNKS